MSVAGGAARRLVAVGGGTRGGLWTQIVSDVTGLPQQVTRESVGASLGDAMLAASADGVDVSSWNPVVDTVRPDPARPYEEFYAQYRSLYPATADIAHFLAEQQHRSARTEPSTPE
jgi:xylulokinase